MFELFVIGSVGTKSKINIIVSFQSGNINTMNSTGNCSGKFSCNNYFPVNYCFEIHRQIRESNRFLCLSFQILDICKELD